MWWSDKNKIYKANGIEYKKIAWKWRRKYKYKLAKDYTITLPKDLFDDIWVLKGRKFFYCRYFSVYYDIISNVYILTIKKDYEWDGCSGPTIDTKTNMRASLCHDCLYQLCRMSIIIQKCVTAINEWFYRILKQDGMCRFRRWYYLKSVNTWIAKRNAKPNKTGS